MVLARTAIAIKNKYGERGSPWRTPDFKVNNDRYKAHNSLHFYTVS